MQFDQPVDLIQSTVYIYIICKLQMGFTDEYFSVIWLWENHSFELI